MNVIFYFIHCIYSDNKVTIFIILLIDVHFSYDCNHKPLISHKAKKNWLLASQAPPRVCFYCRFCSCNNQCWLKCSGNLYRKQPCILSHKRFTDNDRDQQTYGSDRKKFRKWLETDTIFFPPNVKTINAKTNKILQ
jgi:hypothetical protein